MEYFTKDEARRAARTQNLHKSHDQVLRESVASTRDFDQFDVFLSHSSRDAELVRGVKLLLETRGFTVYVDWIADPHLDRSKVTRETADLLRKRMGQCKSLIFVATENASSSKWMPWELGYFDGHRKNSVAVMPLTDRASEYFQGQEYLGLYPLVRKGEYGNGRSDVFVEDVGQRWTTLAAFGKGAPSWKPYS